MLYALLKNSSWEFIFSAGGALCARPCASPAASAFSSASCSAGNGSCDVSFISDALIYKPSGCFIHAFTLSESIVSNISRTRFLRSCRQFGATISVFMPSGRVHYDMQHMTGWLYSSADYAALILVVRLTVYIIVVRKEIFKRYVVILR